MSSRVHIALPGLAGALVVGAVVFAIWVARDSSAGAAAAPQVHERLPPGLYSARRHRAPVARTAITPERQQAFEKRTTPEVATE